jgi:hypothetical protein
MTALDTVSLIDCSFGVMSREGGCFDSRRGREAAIGPRDELAHSPFVATKNEGGRASVQRFVAETGIPGDGVRHALRRVKGS